MVLASTVVVSSLTWNEAARLTAGSLGAWEEGLADVATRRRRPAACAQVASVTALAFVVASEADVGVSEEATGEASGAETGASGAAALVGAIAASVALLMASGAHPTRPADLVMVGVGSVVVLTVVTAGRETTEEAGEVVGMADAETTEALLDPTQSPSENVLDTGVGFATDTTSVEMIAAETTAETTVEMTTASVRTRAARVTRGSESFVGTSISSDETQCRFGGGYFESTDFAFLVFTPLSPSAARVSKRKPLFSSAHSETPRLGKLSSQGILQPTTDSTAFDVYASKTSKVVLKFTTFTRTPQNG